jgi:MGT family glycosyltransferase
LNWKRSMANKILFLPHCTAVGHAGRMLLIAQVLRERLNGTIEFAGNGRYGCLFTRAGFRFHKPDLQGPTHMLVEARLTHFYTQKISIRERANRFKNLTRLLPELIAQEIELYRRVRPDLIVWDGRWTAAIAAEAMGIPFISVMNTVITPYSQMRIGIPKTLPLFTSYPSLRTPLSRLPQRVQSWAMNTCQSLLFLFCLRFVNNLRASYGLQPFTNLSALFYPGLRTVIVPEPRIFSPVNTPPPNFQYVGPVVWEPRMEIPGPIQDLKDIIYITMGTTGHPMTFRPLLDALASMPQFPVVVTVADLAEVEALKPLSDHVHVYPFLPGNALAQRSRLVICHGALATMTQALSRGVPVLAIPLIVPHEIWSTMVERLGAGLKLYNYELTPQKVRGAVEQLLTEEKYRRVAQDLAPQCQLEGGPERAAEVILSELRRA